MYLSFLELTDFSSIKAAAQVWLDTIANVRVHGETQERPSIYSRKSVRICEPSTCISLRPRADVDLRRQMRRAVWSPVLATSKRISCVVSASEAHCPARLGLGGAFFV
jgi:hypothetical protein